MSVSRNGMLFSLLSALWSVAFVTTDTLLCHGFSTALPSDSLVPQELTAEAVFTDIPLAALATAVGYLTSVDRLGGSVLSQPPSHTSLGTAQCYPR